MRHSCAVSLWGPLHCSWLLALTLCSHFPSLDVVFSDGRRSCQDLLAGQGSVQWPCGRPWQRALSRAAGPAAGQMGLPSGHSSPDPTGAGRPGLRPSGRALCLGSAQLRADGSSFSRLRTQRAWASPPMRLYLEAALMRFLGRGNSAFFSVSVTRLESHRHSPREQNALMAGDPGVCPAASQCGWRGRLAPSSRSHGSLAREIRAKVRTSCRPYEPYSHSRRVGVGGSGQACGAEDTLMRERGCLLLLSGEENCVGFSGFQVSV